MNIETKTRYFQNRSFSQFEGKPIADMSIVGYSVMSFFSFSLKVLFGEIVKSKYLIIQIR